MTTKVYVGNLGNHAREDELEDAFKIYGKMSSLWVARRPPGFAFVEYDDPRDAEEAVRDMDGKRFNGRSIRVELSSNRPRRDRRRDDYRPRRRSRSWSPRRRHRSSRSRSRSPHRRSRTPEDRYRKSRSRSPGQD